MTSYPDTPGFQAGSDTSREAADDIAPTAPRLRQQVLDFIESKGIYGATRDEVEESLGMLMQTVSPRMTELARMERIEDSGVRRLTRSGRRAAVWVKRKEEA